MKKSLLLFGLFLLVFLCVWNRAQYENFPTQKGEFLGQRPPGTTPEIFAPGIFSLVEGEFGLSFSPDGRECFFALKEPSGRETMKFMESQNSIWTPPQNVPFVSSFNDCDPYFSSDGQRLYFLSSRPKKGRAARDWDIWYVEKNKEGWSDPVNMEPPVNSVVDEYYVSFTKDGTIYFASNRSGGLGSFDIYRCKLTNGLYSRAENLGKAINSEHIEHDPFIAPDESYLLFTSVDRPDGFGTGDLYISFREKNGTWSKAKNLGKAFNTSGYDFCPMVSHKENYFFFTRNGTIYWVRIEAVLSMKEKPTDH